MFFVRVKFTSAKLVLQDKKNDRVNDCGVIKDRDNFVDINNPIKFEPICNMMHVLFGDRPVSTYHSLGFRKLSDEIVNIVSGGYYRLDTCVTWKSKAGNILPVEETMMGKKCNWNSWASKMVFTELNGEKYEGLCTWWIFKKKYLPDRIELYNEIVSKMEELIEETSIEKKYSLLDVILKIKNLPKDKVKEALDFFKKKQVGPFVKVIEGCQVDPDFGGFMRSGLARSTINCFPRRKVNLTGEFIFPVTDEQYEKLINGPHFATYLDGGFAELITRKEELIDKFSLEYDYKKIDSLL